MATIKVCEGCRRREAMRDNLADVSGGTIVLVSGEAKKAVLAEQRETYLTSKRE